MTISVTTPTLVLRSGSGGKWAEIVLHNVPSVSVDASRRHLELVSGIHVLHNDSRDPKVVAIIGKRGSTEEFALNEALSNRVVEAVLNAHAHVPNLSVQVIDEFTNPNRVFFARVLEAQGPRDRNRPIMAPSMEELRRKCTFPRTDGHRDPSSLSSQSHSLNEEELIQLLRRVFGDEFTDELVTWFAAAQQAHLPEFEELMRVLGGAKITSRFGEVLVKPQD